MSCELCTDIAKTGDIVFEDEQTFVILHNDWSVRGHAMIVAKRHAENPSALDLGEWLHVARVWHRAERVLLALTGAERAIALKLGIFTPHLHVHLYPFSATADRAAVFAAINTKSREPRDEAFIESVRTALLTASAD
jgi:diadenosine tetraphosphate (Ap4A) HIT family hydrolase